MNFVASGLLSQRIVTITGYLIYIPGTVLSTLYLVIYLTLTTIMSGNCYYHIHLQMENWGSEGSNHLLKAGETRCISRWSGSSLHALNAFHSAFLKTRLEFLLWLSGLRIQLVSMRTWVRSLTLLGVLRIWHCCELWHRLQIWLRSGIAVAVVRLAAVAPIWPLAWKLLCAMGKP